MSNLYDMTGKQSFIARRNSMDLEEAKNYLVKYKNIVEEGMTAKSIETILQELEKLQKENEELKEENKIIKEKNKIFLLSNSPKLEIYITKNYISKDKIIDKIEDIIIDSVFQEDNWDGTDYTLTEEEDYAIDVLEELLEEKE